MKYCKETKNIKQLLCFKSKKFIQLEQKFDDNNDLILEW